MKNLAAKRVLGTSIIAALAVAALPLATSAAATVPKVTLVATSADGTTFDFDEYAAGDITVQVTNSVTGSVEADDFQDLTFSWTITPFGANPVPVHVPAVGVDTEPTDVVGKFVVPLPPGNVSGTYALSAGLTADASGKNAIKSALLLTVKAGIANYVFDGTNPLQFSAGTDNVVSGSLQLQDGSRLPGRKLGLGLEQGTTGSDITPDAGLRPVGTTTPVTPGFFLTTDADGAFSAVLSDPAEAVQGTEIGGKLTATSEPTPDIGYANRTKTVVANLVSVTAPTGSTAVLDNFAGTVTPGEVKSGALTVTAPDDTFDTDAINPGVQGDPDALRDPVRDQVYSVSVDHGSFTLGNADPAAVQGDSTGNLDSQGTVLTGLTDAQGQVHLKTGIARDLGFDDDGLVTATVSAVVGDLNATSSSLWDSAHPLNGFVDVALSPTSEQIAPVNPALAGDRTYYDVFTRDQFGNPFIGESVNLTYSGHLDDYDYSDDFSVSDFDTSGDIWVNSFEAGSIKITGTWLDAPTSRYNAALSPVPGTADTIGSATADFYEIDFDASTYSITSNVHDVVKVGTPVTSVVKVLDQHGNPVRGYKVKFFRFGPDKSRGEVIVTTTTNAAGQAFYTFVGTMLGRAEVTAEVTGATGLRTLSRSAVFGDVIKPKMVAVRISPVAKRLDISAPTTAAGARVQLFKIVKGKQIYVGSSVLKATGKTSFKVRSTKTSVLRTYVVLVQSTSKTVAARSNTVNVR